MSQAGWYPDPYGSGSLRWWDGQSWTQHLNPEPPRTATAAAARPLTAQALDVNVRGLQLRADEHGVAYGDCSLAWTLVEWVAYWAASAPEGYGQRSGTQWIFQVGMHPFHGGPRVEVVVGVEQIWLRLVELCRRQAERRLVAELTGRVRAGESVDVAQGLTVHPGGVSGNRVSLSWSAISGAVMEYGRVWILQAGGQAAVLYIPQQNPNAVLIPALIADLKP